MNAVRGGPGLEVGAEAKHGRLLGRRRGVDQQHAERGDAGGVHGWKRDIPTTLPEVPPMASFSRRQFFKLTASGIGASSHLSGELFKQMTGTNIVHVAYKGSGPAVQDLLAGTVQLTFDSLNVLLPHIKAGALRAIAVTTSDRSPTLPDVPTVADTLPGYAIPFWTAIFAPANTPKDIVERIAAETRKAMQNPEVIRRYGDVGIVGIGSSPQELDRFWRAQLDYLGKVVKGANVKPVE